MVPPNGMPVAEPIYHHVQTQPFHTHSGPGRLPRAVLPRPSLAIVNPKPLTIPNELLLEIFPLLPLPSLITAQGVSRVWRHLVPLADILPLRRTFLELCMKIINSPSFIITRPRIIPHIKTFDRQAFISRLGGYLREHGLEVPEEFRFWILEMPSLATIRWLWPGLDSNWNYQRSWRRRGQNSLSVERKRSGSDVHLRAREIQFVHRATLGPNGITQDPPSPVLVIELWSEYDQDEQFTRKVYMAVGGDAPVKKGQIYVTSGLHIYGGHSYTWIEWLQEELKCMEVEVEKELVDFQTLSASPQVSSRLPNDILLDIFDWLPAYHLYRCDQINNDWQQFVTAVQRALHVNRNQTSGTYIFVFRTMGPWYG